LFAQHTAQQAAAGVTAVVQELRCRYAGVKVLVVAVPPTSDASTRESIERLNQSLKTLAESSDANVRFVSAYQTLLPDSMRCDGVHLTASGYDTLGAAIAPTLKEMLGG